MSVNVVVVSGNLTKAPEQKDNKSDLTIVSLRVAVNDRAKVDGEWTDRPNYFSVDVFGKSAENCVKYLQKGDKVTISGRLRWREWQQDDGKKREAVTIVADHVEFPPKASRDGLDAAKQFVEQQTGPVARKAQEWADKAAAPASDPDDDDIPW